MGYYEHATSYVELRKALRKCCRNVRWKDSVVGYEANAAVNTARLCDALESGTYRISPYQVFEITEPKRRRIVASRLSDRQVQRALCDCGLYDDLAEHFVRDNYACQRGRGTDDAMDRLTYQLRRYFRQHGAEGWYLKCDVKKFFASIPHDVAKAAVAKRVTDERVACMVYDVIDSFDGERGLGLGSQISQLVALCVLDDMDHMIRERLGVRCYARYMDDFVLVHESREHVAECRRRIEEHLQGIGLELNAKTIIQPLRHGIWFLQWKYVLTKTGKVLRLMSPGKVRRWRRKLRKLWARESRGDLEEGTTREAMGSFLANARRGNTARIRFATIRYYKQLTGDGHFDGQLPRTQEA